MAIKILLADDHKIVRNGLRSLIENQPDMEVVAEAEDGRITTRLTQELRPDVVVMDISMPDIGGIEATRLIIDSVPNIKIIALSMHSDRRFVAGMLKAGASGYLLKDCAFDELAHAIRKVMENNMYLSSTISDAMIQDFIKHLSNGNTAVSTILSPTEQNVLELLAQNKSTEQIASELSMSKKTIEAHRQFILKSWIFMV